MSAPSLSEWLDELVELQRSLEDAGREQTHYGYCVVDDPRDFSPDPECCTDDEIARWKADCERAEKGLPRGTQTTCEHVQLGRDATAIITPSGYGLGTMTLPGDETAKDVAEQIERIIGMISMWREERISDEEAES